MPVFKASERSNSSSDVLEWGQLVASLEKQLRRRQQLTTQPVQASSAKVAAAVVRGRSWDDEKSAELGSALLHLSEQNCQLARRLQQLAVGLLQLRQDLSRQEQQQQQQQQHQQPPQSEAPPSPEAERRIITSYPSVAKTERTLSLPRDSVDLQL